MEAGTTSTTLTARLPILNPKEYDLWLLRIEQYFLMTDYSSRKRNEMKARGTMLMELPNKDQVKFHSYKDAELLFESIEKRNKEEIETISLDDLYNYLKIYEPELTGSSSTSQNLQNVDFVSSNNTNSNSSTNEADNTAYGSAQFSSTCTRGSRTIDPDDLEEMDLQWEMAMLTIRARRFVPQAVLTKSGKINTAGASVNTVVRPVNTACLKSTVNHPRSISNAYRKGYSQVTRPFNKYSEYKNSIFNKKVNTIRVKDTTARDRAVVSENKGKGVNDVKASACWVWKAKNSSGNPQQKKYKEKGVIDSGCSRHITGNRCYLTEYEDYDGGFISFGDGKGRISGK
ncbi:hypothetical protein Tco_1382558, partial [Tanacetum coccineum]